MPPREGWRPFCRRQLPPPEWRRRCWLASANGAADRWIALPRLPIAYRYRFLALQRLLARSRPAPVPVQQQDGHR